MTACPASLPALPGRSNQKRYGFCVENILPSVQQLSLLNSVELERLGGRVYNALVDHGAREGGLSRQQLLEVLRPYRLDAILPDFAQDALFAVMADSSSPSARVPAEVFMDFFPALMGLVILESNSEESVPAVPTTPLGRTGRRNTGTCTIGPNQAASASPSAALTIRRHSGAQAGVRTNGWPAIGKPRRTHRGTAGLTGDRYAVGSRNLAASALLDRRTGQASSRSPTATNNTNTRPGGAMGRIPESRSQNIPRRASQYSTSSTVDNRSTATGSDTSESPESWLPSLSPQDMKNTLRSFGGRMANFILRPAAEKQHAPINSSTTPAKSSGFKRRPASDEKDARLTLEVELEAVFRLHGIPAPGSFDLDGRGVSWGLHDMGWGQSEVARAFVELFLQVPRRRLPFSEFKEWYLADISGAPKAAPNRCMSDKSHAWEKVLTSSVDENSVKHKGWGSMPALNGVSTRAVIPGSKSSLSGYVSRRGRNASDSRRCTT
mmetsp:Transcript_41315/g.74301  ORF Transcript_41315/g.74301 Transcript_41315/m.74301 type:complete len:494 (-) Transcript_41315:37-1518(-)